MTINLDKNIYNKDSIYKSLEIWNEYLLSPKVSENNTVISILINNKQIKINTINEFLNYILDLTSSMELS
jgi:hypothetical protein|tara:strand:+ start:256 stop:465 length:210 start_codon:yes stop_codon:yes gene_type:complete